MPSVTRGLCAAVVSILIAGAAACGNGPKKNEPPTSRPETRPAAAVAEPDRRPVIAAFGDSLTAGRGVLPEEDYPAQLQRKLDAEGYNYQVVNAGISGETSAQGLNRLRGVLSLEPVITIVELGANDGLRGIPAEVTRSNLAGIVRGLKSAGSEVILAGMEVPPNYGPAYTQSFRAIFPELAREFDTGLVPFFLEGVGGVAELNQDDGIHPTARGYEIVVDNVWKALQPLLRK